MKSRRFLMILLGAALLAGTAMSAAGQDLSHPSDLSDRSYGTDGTDGIYRTHRTDAGLSREDLYALLSEANAAGDPAVARPSYDRAILLYERIIEAGNVRNAGLYYNLANAYLLKEDLGRAILNYRRAERLVRAGLQPAPTDLDIQKNLAFARSRRIDRVETAAQKRVLETLFFWHYDLSLRMRFLLACVAFAVLCLWATAMVWRGRRTGGMAAVVLLAVCVVGLLASILVETHRQSHTLFGVITAAEVVARQGDGPNYPPSFQDPLHAGTEFEVLAQRPGWIHIRLSDGTDAWIPEDAAGLV